MRARKLGLIPQVRKHKTKGDMTESRTAERCEDSRSYRLGYSNDSTMAQLGVSASMLMVPVMEPTWQLRKTGCGRGHFDSEVPVSHSSASGAITLGPVSSEM